MPVTKDEALKEAQRVLRELVHLYVANLGTNHEFVCCITPKHASSMTFAERRADKTWRAWDDARELLDAIQRLPDVNVAKGQVND